MTSVLWLGFLAFLPLCSTSHQAISKLVQTAQDGFKIQPILVLICVSISLHSLMAGITCNALEYHSVNKAGITFPSEHY